MKYLLSLGSNLGNRLHNLSAACDLLQKCCGAILTKSAVYETSPWGFEAENWFYNQALVLETGQKPEQLMSAILEVEKSLGRNRYEDGEYHSRSVDVDILLAEDLHFESVKLTIPHPRMHLRNFVLVPAAEIAGDWVHPVFQKTVRNLLKDCKDQEVIKKL